MHRSARRTKKRAKMEHPERNVTACRVAAYGARDAALAWEDHYSNWREANLKPKRPTACQNAFYHAGRAMRKMAHGDDFLTGGPRKEDENTERRDEPTT